MIKLSSGKGEADIADRTQEPRISSITEDGDNEDNSGLLSSPSGYGPRNSVNNFYNDMAKDDERKLSRFNGKESDDYNLWRIRAETALRGKKIWNKLHDEGCSQDIRDEAASILVTALGDSAFRVCSSKVRDPLGMLDLLDKRYASCRAASRISVLTTLFSKKYLNGQDMARFVDEFEALFAQLEKMGSDTVIPESFKAPLLLASLGTNSSLESTIAALRLRDVKELRWESVTADLIQEYKRNKASSKQSKQDGGNSKRKMDGRQDKTGEKGRAHALKAGKSDDECEFCGKPGHVSEKCFVNPDSSECRLSKKAIDSMKALHVDTKNKGQAKKIEFGSTAVIVPAYKVQENHERKVFLDSGASVTLFKSER